MTGNMPDAIENGARFMPTYWARPMPCEIIVKAGK
jgi:hypothetical protein